MLVEKLDEVQCIKPVKSRVPTYDFYTKKLEDFLVIWLQKLDARGHRALLEHSLEHYQSCLHQVYVSSTAFSGVRVSFLVQPFSDAFTAMTPFFLLINQCDGCCFFWLGGSWLEGAVLLVMGA